MVFNLYPTHTVGSDFFEEGFFDEIDKWKTHNQKHSISKFKSNALTDDEYEKVKDLLDTMHTTEDYKEYKKAFDKFCYFCHMVSRGVIFKKCELKKGEPDHHSLYVEYSYNTKKIQLDDDVVLYHVSSVGGIKELIPQFRGKSAKGYMYDKSRVYFTIRKNMPKFLADYKMTEKTHLYVCKEKIKDVYVDPLVWTNFQGAVYVETTKPIKVEEVTKSNITSLLSSLFGSKEDDKNEDDEKSVEESVEYCDESSEFNFDEFYNFVTENGFTIINE